MCIYLLIICLAYQVIHSAWVGTLSDLIIREPPLGLCTEPAHNRRSNNTSRRSGSPPLLPLQPPLLLLPLPLPVLPRAPFFSPSFSCLFSTFVPA